MKTFIAFAVFVAVAVALPLNVFEDENGQEFVVVPVHRQKRGSVEDLCADKSYHECKSRSAQAIWKANQNGFSLGQKGNVFSNDNHQIEGSYSASKAWGSHGIKPDTFGGRVDYTSKPSGSGAFVGVDRTPGFGTDVSAGAKYNIVQGKDGGVDITAQYGRHFGGPGGTGKPEGSIMLNAEAKI